MISNRLDTKTTNLRQRRKPKAMEISFFYCCECIKEVKHKVNIICERMASSTHGDDATNTLSLQHVIKGLVDFREWHCVSDEFLKLQLLVHVLFHNPGNVSFGFVVPEESTL